MNAAVWIFLQACVCGTISGAVYELFRLFRLLIPAKKAAVFCQDGLYFLIISLWLFRFTLRLTSGRLRVFILIGWGLGAVLWYCTAGALVYGFFKSVVGLLHRSAAAAGRFWRRTFRRFPVRNRSPLGHSD